MTDVIADQEERPLAGEILTSRDPDPHEASQEQTRAHAGHLIGNHVTDGFELLRQHILVPF